MPTVMTVVAISLAFVMIRLDQQVFADRNIRRWWFFEGGAEGARGVLGAISGTMITVATTVFSITIVALQLGSSQFSPRILRGFTRDRGNQFVLGIFIATFVYTLLILRAVQSERADQAVFVPSASVTLAMLLALGSIGSLIFFFHHATRTIQASVVIDRAANDTFSLIRARQERVIGEHASFLPTLNVLEPDDLSRVRAGRSGYVTGIDTDSLLSLATELKTVITIVAPIGGHVLSLSALATMPSMVLDPLTRTDRVRIIRHITKAFEIEIERTLEHDILLGFQQLTDIAIKALSPGINDPSTALTCIDRIAEGLLLAQHFRPEMEYREGRGGHGGIRQTWIGFADIVDECLPQIRHYGAGDMKVMCHLLRVIREVSFLADDDITDVLADHTRLIVEEAKLALVVESDRQRVREAGAWAFS
ncbi:MAG: DUF2254 domain-containing protein [Thermomicrobiales bacterium]